MHRHQNGSPYRKQGRPLHSKAGKKSIFPALILSLLQAINYDRCGRSLDLNGDRPIEPHPTSNDGIYRLPDLGEVRGTACLGVMEVIDYPLAPYLR